MNDFRYLTPTTIQEAISMHIENSSHNSIYMAGGTDVLLKIKEKKISPKCVVSLKHIKEHNTITLDRNSGILSIGAFVTHRNLEKSNLIRQKYKIIHDAVQNIGSVQIRNVATIGGNLVNAVPSADGAIPLIALDSLVRLYSKNGTRTIKLVDFFLAPGKTILKPNEILTEILVPKPYPWSSGSYKKFTRRAALELPIVGVAVALSLEKTTNICTKARICLGVAAPTPIRALTAEKFLEGNLITEKLLTKAGSLAALSSNVRDSHRGKAWHRRELIAVFVKRMALLAIKRIRSRQQLK